MLGRLGTILLILGIGIALAAYASPSLAIVSVSQYDGNMVIVGDVPSSTSSASPTALTSPTEMVWAEFEAQTAIPTSLESSYPITLVSDSLSVNGVSTAISSTATTWVPATSSSVYGAVVLRYDPSQIPANQLQQYTFNAKITYDSETFSGTVTVYGELTSVIANVGHFYIGAPGFSPQQVTPASHLYFNFSALPQPITIYYVEDSGVTTGFNNLYVIISSPLTATENLSMHLTNTTTLNGYTAYSLIWTVSQGTSYSVYGYIGNTSSHVPTIEVMSFITSFPALPAPPTPLTTNQVYSIAAGGLLAVIGLGVIIRRFA